MAQQNEILVVDDEIGIRELLSEILAGRGLQVSVAENAGEARAAARARSARDLVLLDIWMPDTDGITLLREWAANGQLTMPVVMMSGHGTIETAVEATRIGALRFSGKADRAAATACHGDARAQGRSRQGAAAVSLAALGTSPPIADVERRLQHFLRAQASDPAHRRARRPFEIGAQALRGADGPWVKLDSGQRPDQPADVLQQARGGILYCNEIGNYPEGAEGARVRPVEVRKHYACWSAAPPSAGRPGHRRQVRRRAAGA